MCLCVRVRDLFPLVWQVDMESVYVPEALRGNCMFCHTAGASFSIRPTCPTCWCACVCVWLFVCLCVYACLCAHLCVCVCLFVCVLCVFVCVCAFVCAPMCVCVCDHMCVCVCATICVRAIVFMFICLACHQFHWPTTRGCGCEKSNLKFTCYMCLCYRDSSGHVKVNIQ